MIYASLGANGLCLALMVLMGCVYSCCCGGTSLSRSEINVLMKDARQRLADKKAKIERATTYPGQYSTVDGFRFFLRENSVLYIAVEDAVSAPILDAAEAADVMHRLKATRPTAAMLTSDPPAMSGLSSLKRSLAYRLLPSEEMDWLSCIHERRAFCIRLVDAHLYYIPSGRAPEQGSDDPPATTSSTVASVNV